MIAMTRATRPRCGRKSASTRAQGHGRVGELRAVARVDAHRTAPATSAAAAALAALAGRGAVRMPWARRMPCRRR